VQEQYLKQQGSTSSVGTQRAGHYLKCRNSTSNSRVVPQVQEQYLKQQGSTSSAGRVPQTAG